MVIHHSTRDCFCKLRKEERSISQPKHFIVPFMECFEYSCDLFACGGQNEICILVVRTAITRCCYWRRQFAKTRTQCRTQRARSEFPIKCFWLKSDDSGVHHWYAAIRNDKGRKKKIIRPSCSFRYAKNKESKQLNSIYIQSFLWQLRTTYSVFTSHSNSAVIRWACATCSRKNIRLLLQIYKFSFSRRRIYGRKKKISSRRQKKPLSIRHSSDDLPAHRFLRSSWIPTWARRRRMRAENMQIYMRTYPRARFLVPPGCLTARFTHLRLEPRRPMRVCHSVSLSLSLSPQSLAYATINETCLAYPA